MILAHSLHFDFKLITGNAKTINSFLNNFKPDAMKTISTIKMSVVALTIATMLSLTSEAQPRNYFKNNGQNQKNIQLKKNNKNIQLKGNKKVYTYTYSTPYEYIHPEYGHVYRRFYTAPVRLGYDTGYIYYYDSNYYRFQKGIGYIKVATPQNLVFVNIPYRMEPVRVGIHTYYRYGNLVFERLNQGYKLASNIQLNINLNF